MAEEEEKKEVSVEDKISAVDKVWPYVSVTDDSVAMVARYSGMTLEQFKVCCYDVAKEQGQSILDTIEASIRECLNDATRSLQESGLSRTTIWRIKHTKSLDTWQEEIEKSRERKKKSHDPVKLTVIGSKESNDFFGDDFLSRVVFSVLCKAYANGHKSITMQDMWQTLHGTRFWQREKDWKGFVDRITKVVEDLDSRIVEQAENDGDNRQRQWIYNVDENGIMTMHYQAKLWKDAGSHVAGIVPDMVSCGSHLENLAKIYLAWRITLCNNEKNHMGSTVLFSTLDRNAGGQTTIRALEGYMRCMEKKGYVSLPQGQTRYVHDRKIEWTAIRKKEAEDD